MQAPKRLVVLCPVPEEKRSFCDWYRASLKDLSFDFAHDASPFDRLRANAERSRMHSNNAERSRSITPFKKKKKWMIDEKDERDSGF